MVIVRILPDQFMALKPAWCGNEQAIKTGDLFRACGQHFFVVLEVGVYSRLGIMQ